MDNEENLDFELKKVKNGSDSKLFTYIFGTSSAILLIAIAYILSSYNLVDKNQKTPKHIEKAVNFSELPQKVQSNYISNSEHERKQQELTNKVDLYIQKNNTLNEEISTLNLSIKNLNNDNSKLKALLENKTEKSIIQEIEKENKTVDTKDYALFRCYDMIGGGYHISKKCINNLHTFLDNNSDAINFEIIGVVNNKDFKLLTRLKDVYKESNINKLQEFAQYGLSRKRVIEATWAVKKYLGDDVKIQTVNYTAISKKGKKGFVIRAYR